MRVCMHEFACVCVCMRVCSSVCARLRGRANLVATKLVACLSEGVSDCVCVCV